MVFGNEMFEKIKENLILQAEYYLKQFESFYPFGCVIEKNDNIKPVSAFLENDNPDTVEVLNELTNGLRKGIQKKDYKAVGIAVDVSVIPPNKKEKMDALELRIWNQGKKINIYIPYTKSINGEIIFLESYEEEGTLAVD